MPITAREPFNYIYGYWASWKQEEEVQPSGRSASYTRHQSGRSKGGVSRKANRRKQRGSEKNDQIMKQNYKVSWGRENQTQNGWKNKL